MGINYTRIFWKVSNSSNAIDVFRICQQVLESSIDFYTISTMWFFIKIIKFVSIHTFPIRIQYMAYTQICCFLFWGHAFCCFLIAQLGYWRTHVGKTTKLNDFIFINCTVWNVLYLYLTNFISRINLDDIFQQCFIWKFVLANLTIMKISIPLWAVTQLNAIADTPISYNVLRNVLWVKKDNVWLKRYDFLWCLWYFCIITIVCLLYLHYLIAFNVCLIII